MMTVGWISRSLRSSSEKPGAEGVDLVGRGGSLGDLTK